LDDPRHLTAVAVEHLVIAAPSGREIPRPSRTPVGVTDGEASFLIYSDHLGTLRVLADMDGNVVQAMWYDAFGNLLAMRGDAVRLPLGFAGGLLDADTGLTRFVWRDYDADTGRFTALDPMGAKGGDSDLYGYCVDDPVNRLDAWGLADDWWDGARKIGAGLEQLWDKAPDGITQAVSKGAQGAQEAVRKAAEAYVTNDDLQKYTGMAIGAGALPIAAAGGVEATPAIVGAVARNPGKVENVFDFLSGAFVPGPHAMTWGGVSGGGVSAGLDYIKDLTRNKQ